MDKKKIWILYICTWEYIIFRKDFYLSAQQYFLKDHEIHYFVFTDSETIYNSDENNSIHIIHHKHLWRPNATLMRFHSFLWAKDRLENMDYLFFCNADLEIKQLIWNEILPNNDELIVTQHPWFYNKNNREFTYERNKKSTAYIKQWDGDVYIAWWFNGWTTDSFLKMCKTLSNNIDIDNSHWIIALWHDESHINKYILNHSYKLLDSGYLYPEWNTIPFENKIMIRNKMKMKWFGIQYIFQWRNFSLKEKILLLIKYFQFIVSSND